MKNLNLFVFGFLICFCPIGFAQIAEFNPVEASVTKNCDDNQYLNGVRYYYYPNLEAYYDLKTSKYLYKQFGNWVKKKMIPSNYRGYGLYNNFHVVLKDYFDDTPHEFIQEHKKKYPADFKGRIFKTDVYKGVTSVY